MKKSKYPLKKILFDLLTFGKHIIKGLSLKWCQDFRSKFDNEVTAVFGLSKMPRQKKNTVVYQTSFYSAGGWLNYS